MDAAPASSPAPTARGSIFIGRKFELAALRTALDRACAGEDQLVMLAGDAGMGKTRLCQELAGEARRRGVQVLWGRCFEEPGAPPYWPWLQALRTLLDTGDDDRLRELLGAGAAHIAAIVPEVGRRLSDLSPVEALQSDQARFQLFHAIVSVWQRAAEERPLLLILDNLHWADPTSLRLLAFLAAELGQHRLLVVGTYRETELSRQHPLTETLAEFTRYPHFQRLHLTGLSRDETEQLLASACGATPSPATVTTIYERTEGHPLFLVETVRYLLTEVRARISLDHADASALTAIPSGVREIIGKRLNRLSASCARVLSVAACIGRAFPLELLPPLVSESSEDAVLAALEEAQAARVIEPSPRPDHFQFSHALIRETLYDEMLATRRVRVHQRIAEQLEARPDRESQLPQLAYHFSASLPLGHASKALDYAQRAAERAAQLLAHEEAVRLFRLALQLQQAYVDHDRRARCRLLLGLGSAQSRAGDNEAALDTFAEAASIARDLADHASLRHAALGFEGAAWPIGIHGQRAATLLEEALSRSDRPEEREEVELQAALCRAYAFSVRPAEAITAWQRAVALARRAGDPRLLFKALAPIVTARYWPELLEQRLAAAREALAVAEAAGHPEWTVGELTGWHFGDLVEAGDIPAAREVAALHLRVAESLRQPFLQMVGLASQTVLALYEGGFGEAETLAQRALAVGRRFSSPTSEGVYGLQMFVLRRTQGKLGEVLPLLEHIVRTAPAAAIWRPGLALIYAELGMAEEARRELEALAGDDFTTIAHDGMWSTNMVFLAEVCAYLGDATRARILYRMLSPLAGRNCMSGAHTACFGSADRFLGMLANAAGDRDVAERHFEAALAMDARCGGGPGLAHTQYCYAALLARQRERGTERALGLLAAALDTARELGMATLEKRCLALKDKLEGRLAYPDGLSKREVDVLRYLAAGKSNREIGEVLFISANTVANHIQSILAKTGTANRTEAAAYAIRHQLVRGYDRAT